MLRDIVLMQKRELERRLTEPYVPRTVQIPEPLGDLILVILGPRRAGKSFFAMRYALTRGPFGYVNFDDERLVDLRDHDQLIAAVDSVYEHPRQLLLDEVQNVPGWELLVNRLQRQGYRLIVTGSNAQLLSAELATHLTGRHIPAVLLPFSFPEYVQSRSRELTQAEIVETYQEYLERGGFPEPAVHGLPVEPYLRTLVHSTLYKDVVLRYRIRSPQALEDLSSYLMSNIARRFSWNALSGILGGRSVHTVRKYFSYLERAFLFFAVPRFSFKIREQGKSPQKVYCIDNGLVTSTAFQSSANRGPMTENLVAAALHKQELDGRIRVGYWQGPGQEEVDFVIHRDRRVHELIQVTTSIDQPSVLQREFRGLLKAGQALRCENLTLLNDDVSDDRLVSWYGTEGRVRLIPTWQWMMNL